MLKPGLNFFFILGHWHNFFNISLCFSSKTVLLVDISLLLLTCFNRFFLSIYNWVTRSSVALGVAFLDAMGEDLGLSPHHTKDAKDGTYFFRATALYKKRNSIYVNILIQILSSSYLVQKKLYTRGTLSSIKFLQLAKIHIFYLDWLRSLN